MRIALSMRTVEAPKYVEARDAISHDWISWLEHRDHVPILLPNGLAAPADWLSQMQADALILTGGDNLIDSSSTDYRLSALRNRTESAALDAMSNSGLPVIGVCRGLHVINNHFGGRVEAALPSDAIGHVAVTHDVVLDDDMAELAGACRIETNSYHRQCVVADGLASDLVAFAQCEDDGLVEGLIHRTLPIIAVQWHPERSNPAAEFDDALITRFLNEGAFWQR